MSSRSKLTRTENDLIWNVMVQNGKKILSWRNVTFLRRRRRTTTTTTTTITTTATATTAATATATAAAAAAAAATMECQHATSLQDCLAPTTARPPGGQQITEAHQTMHQYLAGRRTQWKTFGDPAASRGFVRQRYLCTWNQCSPYSCHCNFNHFNKGGVNFSFLLIS